MTNIKTAKYYKAPLDNPDKVNTSVIVKTLDNKILYVPMDSDNSHYVAIQEWVAAGNKIEEAE